MCFSKCHCVVFLIKIIQKHNVGKDFQKCKFPCVNLAYISGRRGRGSVILRTVHPSINTEVVFVGFLDWQCNLDNKFLLFET